jgi:SAM-dependent methyltransferase
MRTEMVRTGLPDRVHVVGAVAENLPLQTGLIDVAWLSAVVHHFADLEQSAQELRRVVHSGGVLLIRGLIADSAVPRGLAICPAASEPYQAFHPPRGWTPCCTRQDSS